MLSPQQTAPCVLSSLIVMGTREPSYTRDLARYIALLSQTSAASVTVHIRLLSTQSVQVSDPWRNKMFAWCSLLFSQSCLGVRHAASHVLCVCRLDPTFSYALSLGDRSVCGLMTTHTRGVRACTKHSSTEDGRRGGGGGGGVRSHTTLEGSLFLTISTSVSPPPPTQKFHTTTFRWFFFPVCFYAWQAPLKNRYWREQHQPLSLPHTNT